MARRRDDQNLIMSYLDLRKAIGILGVLLPFVLAIGARVLDDRVNEWALPSISDYHATLMRGVFVGILWAIGVFLYSYVGEERPGRKSWEPTDNLWGNAAGVFAIAVALFPNTGGGFVDNVHFISAAALFVVLAYFSIAIFPRSERARAGPQDEERREQRILLYRSFGVLMLICIAVIGLINLGVDDDSGLWDLDPVFWLETIALLAFGASWFIYGETLLTDRPSKAA